MLLPLSKIAAAGIGTAATLYVGRNPILALFQWLMGLSLVRFLTVGCFGLMTDAGLFSILAEHGYAEFLARAVSLGCATFVTWRLNRAFTFGPSGRHSGIESARYAGVALGAQLFSYTVFLLLRAMAPDWPALIALLTGAVLAAAMSFLGQRFFTFSRAASIQ